MATKIAIKRTSVAGRTPNTSVLDTGELALNITDRKLFSSNGSVIFEIGANVSAITVTSDTVLQSETETLTTVTQTEIASFPIATYGGAKIIIQATRGSDRHITELLVTHDGTTAFATEYATITSNTSLFETEVDINGGNVRILATGSSANSTVYKIYETLMKV
jgi:hypothetical protein